MCFSKSHIISEHPRQKCRELSREPGHLSSDRSGCSNVLSSPSPAAGAESSCDIPSGLSLSPQLGPPSMTQNSESTFSMCQTPSVLSPLPELSPLSNSLDQMAIFSKIDLKVAKCVLEENLLSCSNRAQVAENQTETLIVRLAELQRKFKSQPQSVSTVKVRALIGKEWDPEVWGTPRSIYQSESFKLGD